MTSPIPFLGDLDGDLLGFLLLELGHRDLENTVFVDSFDFIGVDLNRQRYRALEVAISPLNPVYILVLFSLLLLLLTTDRKNIVVDADLDVVSLETRQLEGCDYFVVSLSDVHCRIPIPLIGLRRR